MSQPYTFRYVEGDTLPAIEGRLEDFDLTGGSATLVMERPDGTIISLSGTLVDPADGRFRFEWAPSDLRSGRARFQMRFVNAAGEVLTLGQAYVDVEPRIE